MTITRDIVSIPPVSDKMMEDGIGYVKVDALTKGKAQEIAAKIKALENPEQRNWFWICVILLTERRARA